MASRAPVAPRRWPVMDLVEDILSLWACSPKTALAARVSMGSLRPVEVPWALMYWTSSGLMPASAMAMRSAWMMPLASGSGATMW